MAHRSLIIMELSEHKGAGNRYDMHLSAPAGGVAQMVRRPNGMWVTYEDYNHKCEQLKHVMDLVGALMVELDDTKAEVERLKEGNDCLGKMHDKEMERSAWLREEFNRTTAWGRGLESDLSHARVEISFLKAEVERLGAFRTHTIIPNEMLKAEVEQLQNRCDFLEGRNKE